jgi:hypothetical protein
MSIAITTETTLDTLGPDLAAALGPAWRYRRGESEYAEYNARHGELLRPDGGRLHLVIRDRRLWVSCQFPRVAEHGSDDYGPSRYSGDAGRRPHISLSSDRPAAGLAREIARRVLTIYDEELPQAYARKAAHEAQTASREMVGRACAEVLGGNLPEHRRDPGELFIGGLSIPEIQTATVSYEATIRLALHDLNLDQVRAIVAALATHRQANAGDDSCRESHQ